MNRAVTFANATSAFEPYRRGGITARPPPLTSGVLVTSSDRVRAPPPPPVVATTTASSSNKLSDYQLKHLPANNDNNAFKTNLNDILSSRNQQQPTATTAATTSGLQTIEDPYSLGSIYGFAPPSYKTAATTGTLRQKTWTSLKPSLDENYDTVKTKRHIQIGSSGHLILPTALKHPNKRGGMTVKKRKGTNPMDMNASVTSPSGQTQTCDIVDVDESHYSINFVPKEMGVHTVAVKHMGSHIPGSPFQFTVGPIVDGGSHKVKASGVGLQRGTINTTNEFNILTREAGAGGLCIAIEGPSKAEIEFEDRKDGSCGVSYIVTEPGDYIASIKFNDEHIPESPYRIYISESISDTITSVDAKQLNLGNTSKGFQIGRPAAFTVNYSSARGRLRAYVETPSGTQDEAIIQTVDTDQYAVRFIPRENGPHMIYVLNDDRPIPGSPFRFLVGQYDADPGMVHATGDGLKHGIVGEKNRFFVNTVNAGSGALNVTVDGPSKVQLNCHERENGYEFTYLPTEPGQYVITVKYGGNYHIVGSPFTAEVTGQSIAGGSLAVDQQTHVLVETVDKTVIGKIKSKTDSHPERVNCYGLGVKMAHLDQTNQFTIDAANAGMDILLIGIAGPERPCDEVVVKHVGRNQFTVSYNVMERGTHLLMVKWGDQHVPGSPFIVDVP